MPQDEWEGFKADMIAAFVGAILLLIVIAFWIRSDLGPLLINEPCAPGKPVTVDGEKVGCTNDPAHHGRWYPDWSPDEMP